MSLFTDNWIDSQKDSLVEDLRGSLRFRTLEVSPLPGKPFGEEVDKCLKYTLEKAGSLGLKTENLDGYCGICEIGEGDETLGILAHLDVVPEGTGWIYPPYGAEIHDGNIYARGAIDDKGPAYAAMYAMGAVASSGAKFRRKVRLILGCNEETGMKCIKHYLSCRPVPELSFSPDGEYPLTNSEKSILHFTYAAEFPSCIKMSVGEAANVVPGEACALITDPKEGLETAIKKVGRIAHASMPWEGENALQMMLEELSTELLEPADELAVKTLYNAFKREYYGQSLGLDFEDESGRMTVNPGVMRWNEEGFELTVDMRCPVSLPEEKIRLAVEEALKPIGGSFTMWNYKPGYSISDDSEIVQKLLQVYINRTGDADAKPKKIGGGTYSRELPNAVSFGPEGYMCPASCHVANEFIGIDQLLMNAKMIADAIEALACM